MTAALSFGPVSFQTLTLFKATLSRRPSHFLLSIRFPFSSYIQSIGYDVQRFWDETDQMAHENGIDSDLVICARYVCHHEHNWGIKKTAPRAMPTLSNVPIK